MKINRKLTEDQLIYLKTLPEFVTKRNRGEFNCLKNTLLDKIKGIFDYSWDRFKDGTRKSMEYICFLSTEKGYFFTSANKTAAKHDISSKTLYRILKQLVDKGILYRKNFESRSHNGLGNAVYFCTHHPYFNEISKQIKFQQESTTNENYNENVDEKAGVAETPCVERDTGDSNVPTYVLPKELPFKAIDLQSNVKQANKKFANFVPKVLNQMFYDNIGDQLRTIWVKINQSFKTINHSMLNKELLYSVAKNLCKKLVKLTKVDKLRDDELAAYVYRTSLNMFYEELASGFIEDIEEQKQFNENNFEYDFATGQSYIVLPTDKHTYFTNEEVKVEVNSICSNNSKLMEEIRLSIYDYERKHLLENGNSSYIYVKKHSIFCMKQDFQRLTDEQLKWIDEHYDELTYSYELLEEHRRQELSEAYRLASKLDTETVLAVDDGEYPF